MSKSIRKLIMRSDLHKTAFEQMGNVQKFVFDEETFKMRRSLMLFSSALIILCLVNPAASSGSYEVNIGVIKGSIANPWPIYFMFLLATLYHLGHFTVHLEKLVEDNVLKGQFTESKFFFYLSETLANSKVFDFETKANNYFSQYQRKDIEFKMAGGGSDGIYPSKARVSSRAPFINLLIEQIDSADCFSHAIYNDDHEISFSFTPSVEDFTAFHTYKITLMRYRASDLFTSTVPQIYALISVFFGVAKISEVLT